MLSNFETINRKQQWYPIVLESDTKTELRSLRLLNLDLVLWRSSTGLVAAIDRCPHRGAKLSLGWICEDNYLVCAYHGLAYNQTGRCVKIPAHGDLNPPPQLKIEILQIKKCYGIVWTTLQPPSDPLPHFEQWYDTQYRQILCGPYFYKASAYRAMENFLDMAHFPFVHPGTLGDRSLGEIPPYNVKVTSEGIETEAIEVKQSDPDGTGNQSYVTYRYWVHNSLLASFTKTTGTGEFFMFLALTPVSEVECIGWMGLAMNYGHEIEEEKIKAFQDQLVAQDVKIVESQSPLVPSLSWLDEYPLPCDRLVVAYRQWLKALHKNKIK